MPSPSVFRLLIELALESGRLAGGVESLEARDVLERLLVARPISLRRRGLVADKIRNIYLH